MILWLDLRKAVMDGVLALASGQTTVLKDLQVMTSNNFHSHEHSYNSASLPDFFFLQLILIKVCKLFYARI